MGAFGSGNLDLCKPLVRYGIDLPRVIHVSKHDQSARLLSTSSLENYVKVRNALLEISQAMKLVV